MKTKYSSKAGSGFTLLEIMIVVAIIALLASLAVPSLARARDTSRLNAIYSNLRALEEAKEQWALENNVATGTVIADLTEVKRYLRLNRLENVVNETYVPNAVGVPAEADLPGGITLGPFGPGSTIPAP